MEKPAQKKGIHITSNKTMADTDKHDGAQIVQCTMLQKQNSSPAHRNDYMAT